MNNIKTSERPQETRSKAEWNSLETHEKLNRRQKGFKKRGHGVLVWKLVRNSKQSGTAINGHLHTADTSAMDIALVSKMSAI